MSEKIRVSVEWLSGCSGCELSIVDMHEKLLKVLEEIDLVRLPILMDTKEHVEADIGLISGSVRSEHDEHNAKSMRAACKSIIAFGTCPVYGGPQGAGYAHTSEELLAGAYVDNASTSTTEVPQEVPELLSYNRPLDSVIDVDIYIPGCPPHPAFIFEALMSLTRDREVKSRTHNCCFHCDRRMEKREDVTTLRRPFEGDFDRDVCFLSQGCLCFGSVTLDRCMTPCPKVNVPCFSCGGPSESLILEPQKDVRTEVAARMAHLTSIPEETIRAEIEKEAKTHFAYAMASPVFREKPTFLLKKWTQRDRGAATKSAGGFGL